MTILPIFRPRRALLLLCLALLGAGGASAAPTSIATVPLLNITGTGNVKPNVMLLFDNSGSMDQAYTPDFINDSICRSRTTLVGGVTSCDVGHPPFMSPDFNRQYYNPDIRYAPPIKYDGSFYPSMNATETDNWTKVNADGFNAHKTNMFGTVVTSLQNLAASFPDLKWCDVNNSSSCFRNTTTYTYPTDTFRDSGNVTSNPYYYRIAIGEYCTTAALTNCKSVAIGAAAPAGYPIPVRMRWCSNKSLTTCQAKRTGSFIYAKFATPLGATISYGTITIGASTHTSPLTITSVTIPDPSIARTITNGTVSAPLGTNTLAKRQALASDLAASIIAKTGLATQYWACVNTPIGQVTVPSCTDYGLNLGADDIIAVIAITCGATKTAATCTANNDATRAGWAITVASPTVTITPAVPAVAAVAEVLAVAGVPAVAPIAAVTAVARVSPAALIRISGTTSATGTRQTTITWGGFTKSNIDLGNSTSNTSAVTKIVTAIGTAGTVKAYRGGSGQGTSNTICTGASNQYVCLIDTVTNSNVGTPSATAASNLTFTYTAGAGYVAAVAAVAAVPGVAAIPAVAYVAPVAAQAAIPAVTDTIPTSTTAFVAGTGAPSTFSRVDIVAANNSYAKGTNRSDCAGASCTYAEEMTNFANWYSYYKTRLQMMKTSVGMAFAALNSSYKVGFVKLSAAGAGQAINMVPADFAGTARQTWYTTLYDTVTSGSTPIRAAMDSVGKMFANQTPYNYAAGSEVVQYPCQQNFMILTTDGYWNGNNATGVLNNDNVESTSRFCTYARGCVDPRVQTEESISDVALYWYNGGSNTTTVSLRPSLEPDMTKPGLVPAGAGENTHLHMNTYTLGLGMDGVMTYEPNYDTSPTVGGDFYNLITRVSTGCPWNANGAYVWPNPDTTNSGNTVQERVDDLWHAAINGHGKYFSANAPQEVVDGLSSAIANMAVRIGAAAAAATSTPNISQQDNDIFTDTFTTVKWYGELADKKIDIVTGIVGTNAVWNSSDLLGQKVSSASDTRTIKMLDVGGAAGALKNFDYAVMTAGEKAWFDNKCAALTQCNAMSAANKAIANAGTNLVNWLRGQQQYANDTVFRTYSQTANTPTGAAGPIPIVLGDIASSKPAFVRESRKSYTMAGYSAFKAWTSVPANRVATIFTAANDGMLHAFRASNGDEMWAYAPRMTMKKLYNQASTTYGTNHQFTADGSPEVSDVQIDGVWKTVLVAGLNAGGRGFYALDITDTTNPVALWELCADTTVCAQNTAAVVADLGLSFGNPQFGMWNGKWVVFLTSGYNNIPGVDDLAAGDGKGYLYIVDIKTGVVLKKIGTGSGDTGTPSGLARITSISTNPFTDPVTTHVYGGDVLGQMWRFDLTDTAATPAVTVTKMGDAGVSKPITTRPEVTTCSITDGGTTSAHKVVLFGTGRLLDIPDIADASVQSMYMVKDSAATIDIRGSTMVQQTLSLLGSGSNINTYKMTGNAVNLAVKNGWYFDWNLNGGERMNLDPKVVEGGVNMVTTIPSASSECSVGGSSNVYQVDVCTGSYTSSSTAVGNTLSATSAAVGFIVIRLPSGALKMITTTASGNTLTTGVTPPGVQPARNVGWRTISGE